MQQIISRILLVTSLFFVGVVYGADTGVPVGSREGAIGSKARGRTLTMESVEAGCFSSIIEPHWHSQVAEGLTFFVDAENVRPIRQDLGFAGTTYIITSYELADSMCVELENDVLKKNLGAEIENIVYFDCPDCPEVTDKDELYYKSTRSCWAEGQGVMMKVFCQGEKTLNLMFIGTMSNELFRSSCLPQFSFFAPEKTYPLAWSYQEVGSGLAAIMHSMALFFDCYKRPDETK